MKAAILTTVFFVLGCGAALAQDVVVTRQQPQQTQRIEKVPTVTKTPVQQQRITKTPVQNQKIPTATQKGPSTARAERCGLFGRRSAGARRFRLFDRCF